MKKLPGTKKEQTTMTKTTNKATLFFVKDPMARTHDYAIIQEIIKAPNTLRGDDWSYGILNLTTRVIEVRASTLPIAIILLQQLQQLLDKVRSGEVNGYINTSGNLKADLGPIN